MKPLKFSIPYNNDFKLLKELVKIKNLNGNKIEEIYLSPPQEYIGSGRIVKRFSEKDLKRVLIFCQKNKLQVNLLLNSQCGGLDEYRPKNINKLINFLRRMRKRFNLQYLTLINPFFIEKIKENVDGFKIVVGVNSYIDSVQRALFFKKMGVDILTINRDINRDLKLLKDIKRAAKCKLRIMLNEGCLFKCPAKIVHDNWISHASRNPEEANEKGLKEEVKFYGDKRDFFSFWCQKRIYHSDLSQFLKSPWIRPEDLRKYGEITDSFKIVGRHRNTEYIIRTTKAYMNEFYDGRLTDIILPPRLFIPPGPFIVDNKDLNGFFEKVTACDKNCSKCRYCEKLAKKIIKKIKLHD